MAIQHDMVTQHDFNGGFQLVTGTVRKLRSFAKRDPVGVIMTAPREEARVDYGTGPSVREEKSGKYQRTREFVITLAKKDSDSREWAKNNLPI
jgi:hypothetical protein